MLRVWTERRRRKKKHITTTITMAAKKIAFIKRVFAVPCCVPFVHCVYIKHQAIRILFTTQMMSTFSAKHCIRSERERHWWSLGCVNRNFYSKHAHRFVSFTCDDFMYCLWCTSVRSRHTKQIVRCTYFDMYIHMSCVLFVWIVLFHTHIIPYTDRTAQWLTYRCSLQCQISTCPNGIQS